MLTYFFIKNNQPPIQSIQSALAPPKKCRDVGANLLEAAYASKENNKKQRRTKRRQWRSKAQAKQWSQTRWSPSEWINGCGRCCDLTENY